MTTEQYKELIRERDMMTNTLQTLRPRIQRAEELRDDIIRLSIASNRVQYLDLEYIKLTINDITYKIPIKRGEAKDAVIALITASIENLEQEFKEL